MSMYLLTSPRYWAQVFEFEGLVRISEGLGHKSVKALSG